MQLATNVLAQKWQQKPGALLFCHFYELADKLESRCLKTKQCITLKSHNGSKSYENTNYYRVVEGHL
jgi:hypothetical protein